MCRQMVQDVAYSSPCRIHEYLRIVRRTASPSTHPEPYPAKLAESTQTYTDIPQDARSASNPRARSKAPTSAEKRSRVCSGPSPARCHFSKLSLSTPPLPQMQLLGMGCLRTRNSCTKHKGDLIPRVANQETFPNILSRRESPSSRRATLLLDRNPP